MITLAMIAALAMPPAQFDHAPACTPEIVEVSPSNMKMIVALTHTPDDKLLLGSAAGCVIWLREDLSPAARKRVLRHEYGHLNGWHHQ